MHLVSNEEIEKAGYFYGEICVFCEKKAEEEFFSGSYETYLSCKCKKRQEFFAKKIEFEKLLIAPKATYAALKLEEEIKKLENEKKWRMNSLDQARKLKCIGEASSE